MVVESETGSFEEEIRRVVKQRPKLTEQTFWLAEAPHGIEHEIITTGQPIRCRPRRQNPEKLAIAKAEFRFLVEMGIASRSNSPWASPLHITPKPNGGWRPCGDFRRLNAVTVPDSYSVPRIHDFANGLAGRKWFSKVDLVKGYHQVPIKLEDQPKTAITTPFGLYQFRRMPFGLRNAGATFQRLMDSIFQEFDFVFVYLDDVLIASKSKEEHRRHLSLFFDRLEKHGLFLQASKCQFGVEELEFLGHLVNKEGIKTVPKKVEAIRDYPEPIGAKDPVQAMERFLGMCSTIVLCPTRLSSFDPCTTPWSKMFPPGGTQSLPRSPNLDVQRNGWFGPKTHRRRSAKQRTQWSEPRSCLTRWLGQSWQSPRTPATLQSAQSLNNLSRAAGNLWVSSVGS
jgi:hypothetical protein